MALAWDPATGWKPRGLLPFVSLLHPVFVRERTDKPVEPAYVGTAQVTAIVPYEAADNAAPALRKPSRIVSRRVWTKGGKGGTAVRKALVIETQKGGPDSDWPPFVAFFTDYAAGRKEPLQTSLVVAASLGQAEAAVQAWMEESIKKGWELQRA
jgi:hypothetical protein